MRSHEVDYTIHGDGLQFVEIELDPSESVIAEAGNLKSQFFGGEGLFLTTLQGSGRVWLQSVPFWRLADRIAPFGGGSSAGEGSAIGGLSTLFVR